MLVLLGALPVAVSLPLLNIMGLLDAPSSGKIEINGTSVESMKDKELAAFRNKTFGICVPVIPPD